MRQKNKIKKEKERTELLEELKNLTAEEHFDLALGYFADSKGQDLLQANYNRVTANFHLLCALYKRGK